MPPSCTILRVDASARSGHSLTRGLAEICRGATALEPILGGKAMVLLTSTGEFGLAPGGLRSHMDHLTPHLRTCAHYFGVAEMHHVAMEYQEFGDERHRRSVDRIFADVARLVRDLQCHGDIGMQSGRACESFGPSA